MKPIEAYKSAQPDQGIDALVREHEGLVRRIAYHLLARLPASVQVEDLIQSGVIGLIEAARSFDDSQGARFETYAGIRIRGAMIDELRRSDWTPRSVHKHYRQIAAAMNLLEGRLGRAPSDAELARELEVDVSTCQQWLRDSSSAQVMSLDELNAVGEAWIDSVRDAGEAPDYVAAGDDFRRDLVTAIEQLPEREKLVMSLYYDEELNLREIGEVLEVSESRVCQLHGQAMVRLRGRLQGWLDTTG
jgi:RNA polymerase sigma factor for flagellar operon FliA